MIARIVLAAMLCAALGGCSGDGLTGIAAGVREDMAAPVRPLADPSHASFAFLPFEGVPGNEGDELLRRLWAEAENEGLTVVKRPDGRALFTVEGAITAVSDDTNALIFYTFDVKDVHGRRLHRISGEQRTEESEVVWGNVRGSDLDLIALRVAALLRAWLYAKEARAPTADTVVIRNA
ncbi:MAG: hypothetical protein AAGF45_09030 [Pseudomonadota bacterium]